MSASGLQKKLCTAFTFLKCIGCNTGGRERMKEVGREGGDEWMDDGTERRMIGWIDGYMYMRCIDG